MEATKSRKIPKGKKKKVYEEEVDISDSLTEGDSSLADYCFPDEEKSDCIISLEDDNHISMIEESSCDASPVPNESERGFDILDMGNTDLESDINTATNSDNNNSSNEATNIPEITDAPPAEVVVVHSELNAKLEQTIISQISNLEINSNSLANIELPQIETPYNEAISLIRNQNIFNEPSIPAGEYENFKLLDRENELKPFTESEMMSLYFNHELYNSEAFVSEFVENEVKSGNIVHQTLYILLTNYLKSRDHLCRNSLEFESFVQDYKKYQEQLWTLEVASMTEYEECQDGNPVSATHKYKVSRFNECAFANLSEIVTNLQDFTHEIYTLSVFNIQLYRIKVENYIQTLCSHFSYLPHNSPVSLHCGSTPRGPVGSDYRSIITELKDAVSVLFTFQRRPIKDDGFVSETRAWLEKLLGVLLRIATPDEHLFILNHVLRCPSGIGKWASCYIQPPVLSCGSPYNQQYLDHLITVLASVLLPVNGRELFLQQMENSLEENGMWVIIDSDTEDIDDSVPKNSLKENDVISFLNQIPIGDIYRQILLINRRHEQDLYDVNIVTDRDMLRSFTIGTLLVTLLEKGLANYSADMYRQFCKRLSRLIKHTASYITDHWQMFREMYIQKSIVDNSMTLRLQTEYDAFLFRVVHSLYISHNRIGWQYLTTTPFNMITSQTLWRLYQYLLHTTADNTNTTTSEELMERIIDLPDDDIYYFLTTITNMALDRKKQDWLFIQTVTLQLFQVGFVNTSVRDKCMKSVRILLTNLTNKYPALISNIMLALKAHFSLVGKLSLHLFKELPLSVWKPNQVDVSLISDWLLTCRLSSWENNLARYIISNLNWSLDLNETDLFLPREIHCQIAIIIVRTVLQYAEETTSYGVTQIVRSVITPEQALCTWAWQILSKLRIHLMDQPDHIVQNALIDNRLLSLIPDISSISQDMQTLSNGISIHQCVAHYIALLMTNVGHSIPIICETGFEYCIALLSSYNYTQVLHVLLLIVPYFAENPESLYSSQQFRKIIVSLVAADRTYMKVAKSYITSEFPGTVLSQFGALIDFQIYNYARYGFQNAHRLMELWLRILCSVWTEDCGPVAFLMDRILCIALFDSTMQPLVSRILSELIEHSVMDQLLQIITANSSVSSGGLSSILNWMPYAGGKSTNVAVAASLLPRKLSRIVHSPYFAYFALELEEFHTQTETQLWSTVLRTLHHSTGKANVDNAIKKACSTLKLTPVSSESLAIYRWSQFALDLPVEHPILPLLWQRFFMLYLQRVPGPSPRACVGRKFFEGTVNSNYQRKLKTKLQQGIEYANKQAADNENERSWFQNLATLYRTFVLWLEEMHLQEAVLYIPSLPTQYNPQKLDLLLECNSAPWIEYVNFEQIRAKQKDCVNNWATVLNRISSPRRILCIPEDTNAVKRILDRLKSYDNNMPPPPLVITYPVVPPVQREMLLNKNMILENLNEHFRVLMQHTQSYKIERVDQQSICKKLLDALRHLYSDVETELKLYAACDTETSSYRRRNVASLTCAGPAVIRIRFLEAKKDKASEFKVEKNNKEFQRLLTHNIRTPSLKLTVACVIIETVSVTLQKEKEELTRIGDAALLSTLHDVGITMFYKMASLHDTEVAFYTPTKRLICKTVKTLGQAFVSNVESECTKLLSTVMSNPQLSTILLPHFTPEIASSSLFIHLYQLVITSITPNSSALILNTIKKFDVNVWLNRKKPRLNERSQFINMMSIALKTMGINPLPTLLPIHEVLRKHLCQLLLYEFPEHYGEILHIVLKYSKEEKFSIYVWFDILNALLTSASPTSNYNSSDAPVREGMTPLQVREVARKYASEQRTLTYQELVETANILGSMFLKERLSYGLYGLYPKYSNYIDPLVALNSIVGHASIASMLQLQRGILADRMCEQIWPVLLNLFSPWILPYFTANLNEPAAPWIQQLTEDRSVLLPWIPEDGALAHKMVATFTECLRFILDALPASSVVLQFLCQWYITHFAHHAVKEHILNIVHCNLLTLSWSRFEPDASDLELILKVVDQYFPACHSFLGSVFMQIPWHIVAYKDLSSPAAIRSHIALLHLLIKLANEPNLRQSGKVNVLLMEAQHYSWNLVDAANYESVVNWFVANYDPRVILLVTDEGWNAIDIAAFDLIQVAAGYVGGNDTYHPTTSYKRQIFIRACVKMILHLANRYKTVLASHHSHLVNSLIRMLDKMENILTATVQIGKRGTESGMLLTELLALVNQPNGSILIKLTVQALLTWVTHRSMNSAVLQGLLHVTSTTVSDHQQLGIILEAAITAWFKNSAGMEECEWERILAIVESAAPSYPPLEDSLIVNNQLLTLYTLIMKQLQGEGYKFTLGKLVHWIVGIKPCAEVENKLPLLWSLLLKECMNHKHETVSCLMRFVGYLQHLIQIKQGWALFGVIGLNKQGVPSTRCRLLCYAVNAFIITKLIEQEEEFTDPQSPVESSSIGVGINIASKNGVPTKADCVKAITALNNLLNDKHFVEYKITIELALRLTKSSEITLYSGEQYVMTLAKQLYTDGYIHAFPPDNFILY